MLYDYRLVQNDFNEINICEYFPEFNSHSFGLSTVRRYKQRVYILSETKAVLRDEIKERTIVHRKTP